LSCVLNDKDHVIPPSLCWIPILHKCTYKGPTIQVLQKVSSSSCSTSGTHILTLVINLVRKGRVIVITIKGTHLGSFVAHIFSNGGDHKTFKVRTTTQRPRIHDLVASLLTRKSW